MEMILSVQSCGNNKFRLGISTNDSSDVFMIRGFELMLFLNQEDVGFLTKTKCGPPQDNFDCINCKKAYDLYDIRIHNWILENNYNDYLSYNPTRLSFLYSFEENTLVFQFTIN